VGNISLGGTGKTPLVGWIANKLIEAGYHPGIVMHGYGAQSAHIRSVTQQSLPEEVGDEALVLARSCHCPIVAGRNRNQAVHHLLSLHKEVNMVICDDGLQHYALARDIEIAVIDGMRRFGNGFCLPAGPLRESPSRLQEVDFVVSHLAAKENEWEMRTTLSQTVHQVCAPAAVNSLSLFSAQTVHALAGIGNPERFFSMLEQQGIKIIRHIFDDHYSFQAKDLQFQDGLPLLMTEKDAVKCRLIAPSNAWFVPLEVNLPEEFFNALLRRIESGQKITRHSRLSDLQATPTL
jgi:tetraacyldisaccharide 4'-kinase